MLSAFVPPPSSPLSTHHHVSSSPSESGSELSLSGFETVASNSFEEDEEEDEGSVMLSSPCSSPATSMLQEDHHGDRDETQSNGITKHRSEVQYAPAVSQIGHTPPAPFFSGLKMNKLSKGAIFLF